MTNAIHTESTRSPKPAATALSSSISSSRCGTFFYVQPVDEQPFVFGSVPIFFYIRHLIATPHLCAGAERQYWLCSFCFGDCDRPQCDGVVVRRQEEKKEKQLIVVGTFVSFFLGGELHSLLPFVPSIIDLWCLLRIIVVYCMVSFVHSCSEDCSVAHGAKEIFHSGTTQQATHYFQRTYILH